MKKMLAKAVALSLVLGGVGFVSNNAQAADIGNGVKVHSADSHYKGYDVKTSEKINTTFAEQKDLVAVNKEVTAAQKTANDAQAAAAKNAEAIETKADAWDTVKKFANVQEQLDTQDNKNKAQDASIKANGAAIKANKDAIKANADAIKANKAEADATNEYFNSRIENNTDNIYKNKVAIENETQAREDADKKLSDRINDEVTTRANEDKRIEAKFDGEVSRLDSKIDKLDARVEKVGAMAAAIANLHTMGYDPEAPTEIAVGVGQYRDKTGLALGAFHYPNRDFMLSFSVSTAGDEFMGGIGATWRFGRKSPEELRQAEAEKAAKAKLAKAEAAKKAAKDARVAAQQKRHAEMLAARTGK